MFILKFLFVSVLLICSCANAWAGNLDFDADNYSTQETNGVAFRAYENIIYVENPVEPEYQKLSLYVPEGYFKGETINGYTARTAPIFMPNGVGGYMPGKIASPGAGRDGKDNASLVALSRGCVVAAPAIRGRTLKDKNSGKNTGKAPALIVDYKAAVRYLRYNKDKLPAGDTEKIISNGTSAGGALSALLGATGNAKEYEPYLNAIGAANARDDIFASMAYCPITDLDHADMAYEWIFNGVNEYHQNKAMMNAGNNNRPENAPLDTAESVLMTDEQISASKKLKSMFPDYLNGLKLKDKDGNLLTLDGDGNGSFKEFIKNIYIASAQSAVDNGVEHASTRHAMIDISNIECFTVKDNKVVNMDLAKYAVWATRLKAAPAFDALDNSSGENNEFGTEIIDNQHFTEFSYLNSTVKASMAEAQIIKLLNPLNFIGAEGVQTAKHWRIRHGAVDRDTSLAVPAILALKLMNNNCEVDFKSPWGYGHAGDYDLDELFDWIDSICR